MKRIILTTGGTGGHIFPALATAEALKQQIPDVELLFIGATYGPEARLAKEAGLEFIGLPGRGILGKGFRAIPAIWDNIRALQMAIKAVRVFTPCVVAAFGGYAAFPAACAARILGIPLLLHEQNAVAGTVNRLLGLLAATRCVSLPETQKLKQPYVYTGNPVRQGLIGGDRNGLGKGKHLLVLGGSQGAHALNRFIVNILEELRSFNVEIIHQTGEKDFKRVEKAYCDAGYSGASARPFINDMKEAYNWADLVFCRSGASTVAELCIAGLPSILVPFPAAIHNHQLLNARALQDAGGAVVIPETELGKAKTVILELLANSDELKRMGKAAHSLQRPEAAEKVAEEILRLCD